MHSSSRESPGTAVKMPLVFFNDSLEENYPELSFLPFNMDSLASDGAIE